MKRIFTVLILLIFLLSSLAANAAGEFKLTPADNKITAIVYAKDNFVAEFAAQELQKHLGLVTGYTYQIVTDEGNFQKIFYVGIVPAQDSKKLEADEARYLITTDAVYMYGEDSINGKSGAAPTAIINSSAGRRGTLFAVYDFLEYELGIKWIEPGDKGILYEFKGTLNIPEKSHSWVSPLRYPRGMRSGGYDNSLWMRRMRMGSRDKGLSFGHAFGDWWNRYGLTHPEYFALNGRGERGTMRRIERVKMCVSNQGLVEQIVKNWLEARAAGNANDSINACENDGDSMGLDEYCHCDNCRALDFLEPGEKFGANFTDRYVDFWNRIVTLARKTVPTAKVCGYAYSITLTPPRKIRVADGVVLGFVTRFGDGYEYNQSLFEGWKKMGAKELSFRPNDLHAEIGLPLGIEKLMVEHQQLAMKYGAQGIDHDSLHGYWTGVSGLLYYALAKSATDPEKPYEYWQDDYCSAFGAAREDINSFVSYWQDEVMKKRIYPANEAAFKNNGQALLGYQVIAAYGRDIGKYYNEKDFDITDGFLKNALTKKISPSQKLMVERMLIANKHSRLSYEAMYANGHDGTVDGGPAAKALLDYREAHKNDVNISFSRLESLQLGFGDITGIAQLRANKKRVFDCITVSEKPVIDGILNETFWNSADTGAYLMILGGTKDPGQKTRTYLAHDASNLYIAYEADEALMGKIKESAQANEPAYSDNCIEMFFDPKFTKRDYNQIIISTGGNLYDGARIDGRNSPDWNLDSNDLEYSIKKGQNSWVMEIRLALSALGLSTPKAGDTLRFNLTRDRLLVDSVGNEKSTLAGPFSSYGLPDKFVTMVFK